VFSPHVGSGEWNEGVNVLEDLFVREHPVSKEQVENSRPPENTDSILGHLVIEGRGELIEVRNEDSFLGV